MNSYNILVSESNEKNAEFLREKLKDKRRLKIRIIDTLFYGRSINRKIDYLKSIIYNNNVKTIMSYYSLRLLLNAFLQARNPKFANDFCKILKCYDLCTNQNNSFTI